MPRREERASPLGARHARADLGLFLLLDGKLLVGNEDGFLVMLRAGREKKVLREIEMPGALRSGPAVHDGTLYLATDERLYANR